MHREHSERTPASWCTHLEPADVVRHFKARSCTRQQHWHHLVSMGVYHSRRPIDVLYPSTMSTQLPLRCTCGKVRGLVRSVSPDSGTRVVCYCDDCQAFAHFLERGEVLDANGGTDIFQLPPRAVQITEGAELLRCMRLSDKGLFRFYTECCHTPVGNMVGQRLPFIGLIHTIMDHQGDGRSRDEVLGKPRAYIFGAIAKGRVPPHIHPKAPFGLMVRSMRLVFGWWLRGQGTPSPFFDPQTKAPCAVPRVLTATERETLRQRRTL